MSLPHDASADPADPRPGASWHVRPPEDAELPALVDTVGEALLLPTAEPDLVRETVELDRTLAVFDGPQPVGTATILSLTMTLPGRPRPVAGISGVGVWPTYRRRGVLSAIMRRQFADIRARGEDVAALFASEGGIYGRFGYGSAASALDVDLPTSEAALRPDAPRDPALRLRLTVAEDARKEIAVVHQAAALQRIGEFQRGQGWWNKVLRDRPETRGGQGRLMCAIAEDDAGPLGFVLYRTKQHWDDYGRTESTLRVKELYATAPAAFTLLWEHVLTRDLVTRVSHDIAAPDDPLFYLLNDPYRIRKRLSDNLWVRLVDLPSALEKRSYAAPVGLVVGVSDRYCPWNAGRWRLTADTAAARCTATEDPADVELDVSHLGGAYLGGASLGGYLTAGLITEATPGAVQRLDTALHRFDLPHCQSIF